MPTVLIVDDDRHMASLLELALRKAGFSVLIAADGNQGYAKAMQYPPDVAILDVMMPGVHGYELCRRLRAEPKTAHAKIVFLTARSQPIDQQEAMKAGGDLFLSKPVMPRELVRTLQSLFSAPEKEASLTVAEPQAARTEREGTAASQPAVAVPPTRRGRPRGRLIVCYSPFPGVGVTTVAANLALGFALSRSIQIPVIELGATPGALLPTLGLAAPVRPGDLGSTSDGLNWDALALHLQVHSAGVRVLPGAAIPEDGSPALVERAIAILRERYPLVLVDAAGEIDVRLEAALVAADGVLLVVTPEVSAVRAARHAVRRLRELDVPERYILLAVNHVHPEAHLAPEQIQQGMKRPILGVIPYESMMKDLLEAGKPLVLIQPRSPAARAIGHLVMHLGRGL
jgi:CheY-like chemotaxis protein/MinD-like ATPase involved in chromosome partitioning or flagellar assembly